MAPDYQHRPWAIGFLLAVLAMLFLLCLELGSTPLGGYGLYDQELSSESMMQTVSIRDLKEQPLLSLWNIHIQPPGLDLMRALLAWIWKSDGQSDHDLLRLVDRSLYALWIIAYGMTGFIMFLWISEMTRVWFGVGATIIFLIHPACISYATFLDTTFLTATLVLLLYYLLWRLKEHEEVSSVLLVVTILLLFLTRSLFEWPFLLVLGAALFLMKVSSRKIVMCIGIAAIVMGLYTAKQAYQFGLTSTSSFMGLNLVRSIGLGFDYPNALKYVPKDHSAGTRKAAVLTREHKIDGSVNLNNERFLIVNQALYGEYFKRLRSMSFSDFWKVYSDNLSIYFSPSTRTTRYGRVDRLPWRDVYNFIFSSPVLPILVAIACVVWIASAASTDRVAALGFCLPLGFIVIASVLGERGENMRFKFFVEPVLYVFIATQLYAATALLSSYFGSTLHNKGWSEP
jgi:hypothetical protein